ncbi:MAG TPA: (2Fe-2S)-binding protein [Polyangiaceae bacterium]|nr:(2Fe-2S)-binding protein [Polyangiaceae bacterium]
MCSCYAVSAAQVEELVEDGADTVAAVSAACGAGGDCGACRGQLAEIVAVGRLLAQRPCRTPRFAAPDHAPESAY